MAANRCNSVYLCLISCLLCCFGAHGISLDRHGENAAGCIYSLRVASTRELTVARYKSQIGIREKTGNNDGIAVEMYLRSVGLKKGPPWCAAFVSWCIPDGGAKSAWSPDWFPSARVIWKRDGSAVPQSGDVMGLYFPEKKRIAHVGFVDEWDGVHAITVEGNTNEAGSREGDGVYRKRRLCRQIYMVSDWLSGSR